MLKFRNRHFFLLDLLLLFSIALFSFALRLNPKIFLRFWLAMWLFVAVAVPVKLLVYYLFGLYRRVWRYASVDELMLVAVATFVGELLAMGLAFGLTSLFSITPRVPLSIPFIDGLLTLLAVGGSRFVVRLHEQARQRRQPRDHGGVVRRVAIVGAGNAGAMIAKEMRANPQLGLVLVGFLDDDDTKRGMRIHGSPVLGGRSEIPKLAVEHNVDELIIAMPTAPGSAIREIRDLSVQAGIPARTVPGLYEILSGRVSVSQIRDVEIEDLLRREAIHTDTSAVERMLRGCRVLVTGAGGSIGGEVCRQIARCDPAALILLGHGENSIYTIANELQRLWPDCSCQQVIADVRDLDRLDHLFRVHQPDVVFHAAAHKHVPLMEANAVEAVTNNVLGTANLLRLSETHGVNLFVLISTDKAVSPSSVMGATKRVAEMLVQKSALQSGRHYVAVRFGNVLGSRGSVIPLFKRQIAHGGPVTITHPEVCRYFMTIPEAVQLVLQAAALGQGGEVFVLDMGEPVRIVDLARDLIDLSGLKVGQDIDVVYTGLRPGEKLFEALYTEDEECQQTTCEKVLVVQNGVGDRDGYLAQFEQRVMELLELTQEGDAAQIRAKLKEIVPDYASTEQS